MNLDQPFTWLKIIQQYHYYRTVTMKSVNYQFKYIILLVIYCVNLFKYNTFAILNYY